MAVNLQFWADAISLASAIIALLTAFASFRAASAAKLAATATQQATQAQLMNTLLDSYASPQMHSDLRDLQDWFKKHGQRATDEFRIARQGQAHNVDEARRRISHYFQKIYKLKVSGFLDEAAVRAVADEGQVSFLRNYVEPLEGAISSSYDRSSFDGLGKLYNIGPPLHSHSNP